MRRGWKGGEQVRTDRQEGCIHCSLDCASLCRVWEQGGEQQDGDGYRSQRRTL